MGAALDVRQQHERRAALSVAQREDPAAFGAACGRRRSPRKHIAALEVRPDGQVLLRQQLLLVVAPAQTRINGARAGTSISWRHRSTFVLDKYNYLKYLHAISLADEEVILMG